MSTHTLDPLSDSLVIVDGEGKSKWQGFIWKHDLIIMLKKEENYGYSKHIHQSCLGDYDYDGMSRMLEIMHEKSTYQLNNVNSYYVEVNGTEYIVGVSARPVDISKRLDGVRLYPMSPNQIGEVVEYLSMWKENA